MAKNGLAIIIGKPKPSSPPDANAQKEEEDGSLYEAAGSALLAAIKDGNASEIANIVADICRMAKDSDY